MRERSETWTKLAARGQFSCESVLVIGEKVYTTITAPIIERTMMSSPLTIGKCTSATLQVSIMTDNDIDISQPIIVKARLTDDETYSEWIEFGTFFVDRMTEEYEGLVSLTCYDSMLKIDQPYYPVSSLMYVNFKTAIEDIAAAIGVEIDERTAIWGEGIINWHTNTYGTFTMRQVLESIAAISGGNWIITEENRLRLVPIITVPNETFDIIDSDYNTINSTNGDKLVYQYTDLSRPNLTPVLNSFDTLKYLNKFLGFKGHINIGPLTIPVNDGWYYINPPDDYDSDDYEVKIKTGELVNVPVVTGRLTYGKSIAVSGVVVTDTYEGIEAKYGAADVEEESRTDDEVINTDFGDLGTYTVSVETSVSINSFLSAAYRAQKLCYALIGLVYTPYEATSACFDPAAELGDWIKIGNVRSVIYNMKLTLDTCFRCDLSAPSDNKVESLYPYAPGSTSVQTGTSYGGVSISKSDGVTVMVSKDDTAVASFSLNESGISFNIIDADGNEQSCIYFDASLEKYHISDDVVIDGVNNDTGWINVPLTGNFEPYSSSQVLQYRKIGKIVEIRGAVKPTATLSISDADDAYTIGNLPSDCAPSSGLREIAQGSGVGVWMLSIDTNGAIKASRHRNLTGYTNFTTSNWLPMHTTYLFD